MEAQTFILTEIPPSTNNLFATVKGGTKRVRTMKYRSWSEIARWQIAAHKPVKMSGPVGLDIRLKRPRKGADVSNRIKAIEDALTGLVYDDDSQVQIVTIAWDASAPGCIVTVRPA
jgi:Holliday junction resolvase RusA-like endonuclease